VGFFANLLEAPARRLAEQATVEEHPDGSTLCRQGAVADGMLVLLSGSAHVYCLRDSVEEARGGILPCRAPDTSSAGMHLLLAQSAPEPPADAVGDNVPTNAWAINRLLSIHTVATGGHSASRATCDRCIFAMRRRALRWVSEDYH
jgi:hypothetical protein